ASLTLPELVTAILDSAAPRLDEVRHDIPSEVASVVQRCLAKDREARFASAGDLAMALLPYAGPRARLAAEQAQSMRPVFAVRSSSGDVAAEAEGRGGAPSHAPAMTRLEPPNPDREAS